MTAQSTPQQQAAAARERLRWMRRCMLAGRIAVATALAAVTALGWTVFGWETSLNVALAILTAFVAVETATNYLWARRYFDPPETTDAEPAAKDDGGSARPDVTGEDAHAPNPYADAAKVAITTQGVVLGLVTFGGGRLDATVRIGAAALAFGVLAAVILYLNVALGPPPDLNRWLVASILFTLVLWSLGFGLICVVAGSWA